VARHTAALGTIQIPMPERRPDLLLDMSDLLVAMEIHNYEDTDTTIRLISTGTHDRVSDTTFEWKGVLKKSSVEMAINRSRLVNPGERVLICGFSRNGCSYLCDVNRATGKIENWFTGTRFNDIYCLSSGVVLYYDHKNQMHSIDLHSKEQQPVGIKTCRIISFDEPSQRLFIVVKTGHINSISLPHWILRPLR
jgi:hypothetical protein